MKKQMWFCETCNKKYSLKSKLFHLISNEHRFKKLCLYREGVYRELYPTYEDYRLCQIKGFVENMPYMSFLEFVVKCELINHHHKWEFKEKLHKEAENKNIETKEEYEILENTLLAEKGEMTLDEFVKLSKYFDKLDKAVLKRKYKSISLYCFYMNHFCFKHKIII